MKIFLEFILTKVEHSRSLIVIIVNITVNTDKKKIYLCVNYIDYILIKLDLCIIIYWRHTHVVLQERI
jgi:hypothetical protein